MSTQTTTTTTTERQNLNTSGSQLQTDQSNRQVLGEIVIENTENNGEHIEGEKIPKVPEDPAVANLNLLTALNDNALGHCILAYGNNKPLNPACVAELCRIIVNYFLKYHPNR